MNQTINVFFNGFRHPASLGYPSGGVDPTRFILTMQPPPQVGEAQGLDDSLASRASRLCRVGVGRMGCMRDEDSVLLWQDNWD